jgi:hypothetical protein
MAYVYSIRVDSEEEINRMADRYGLDDISGLKTMLSAKYVFIPSTTRFNFSIFNAF